MRCGTRLMLMILVAALGLMLVPAAHAWQNGNATRRFGAQTTQQWILSQAERLATAEGADWLDLGVALDAVGDPDTRYRDFRFHRYQRWGGRHRGAAPARVSARYSDALKALENGDRATASRELGLLAHYYTDACDPLHTAQSKAEKRRSLHKRYEQRVHLLLNRARFNRVNKCASSAKVADLTVGPREYTALAAKAAHADYAALIRAFQRHGFDGRSSRITERVLRRAVAGLAALIVRLDQKSKPGVKPTPTPSATPTTAPLPTPTPSATRTTTPLPTPTPSATRTTAPSPTPSPTATARPSERTVTVSGTTTEAVDEALRAAVALGSGTTVYFPPATYHHGTSLTIPDGISLKGAGIGATILDFSLVFGSDQTVSDMRVGAAPKTALFSRSGTTARHTTFLRVRFRGGGPVPGTNYDATSTAYVGYNALIQLGGKESTRSASDISFVECEFERVSGPWVSRYVRGNTISAWEDNRSGRAHLEYISFTRCHFGVKNAAGDFGALSANVELKTNTYTQYPEFAHNWHDWTFKDCVFERSGDFNLDFTDSSRAWLKANNLTESGTTDGVPNWTLVPIKYHAGIETGHSVTISGGIIKGCGFTSAPEWTYVICLENPLAATITGVTAYGGNRTQSGMISSSSACGPWLGGSLPAWPTPLTGYSTTGMQAAWNNNYTPGVWGAYTPSPHDP